MANKKKYIKGRFKFILLIASILLVFATVLIVVKYLKKNYNKYDYETKVDYELTIEESKEISLRFQEGKIEIPKEVINSESSYFLRFMGKSTFLGKVFPPFVEIRTKTYVNKIYFESGFEGTRFLNLTHAISGTNSEIIINTEYCNIQGQTVQLVICRNNKIDKTAPLLVLSPHPDDAELAAFGTYSSHPNAFILTITSGEYGDLLFEGVTTDTLLNHSLKGKLRTWNSITIPKLGGVKYENTLNMGFFDGTLEDLYMNRKERIRSKTLPTTKTDLFRDINFSNLKDSLDNNSSWGSLVSNIEVVLRNVKPKTVISPHPSLDTHPDHQYTTRALLEALKNQKMENIRILLYSNHYLHSEYFPFGPASNLITIPPIFASDSIQLKSIISNELSEKAQINKILALEAMHDLRFDVEWLNRDDFFQLFKNQLSINLFNVDFGYRRRAIKDNELFFVVEYEDCLRD